MLSFNSWLHGTLVSFFFCTHFHLQPLLPSTLVICPLVLFSPFSWLRIWTWWPVPFSTTCLSSLPPYALWGTNCIGVFFFFFSWHRHNSELPPSPPTYLEYHFLFPICKILPVFISALSSLTVPLSLFQDSRLDNRWDPWSFLNIQRKSYRSYTTRVMCKLSNYIGCFYMNISLQMD